MNLYDINQQLIDTVEMGIDVDTGVILEGQLLDDKINELAMALDDKMENIACYIKNLNADYEALKAEKQAIDKRMKTKQNKVEYLKKYLSTFMQANDIPKFETPKCAVSFRKSTSVEVTDMTKIPKEYIKEKVELSLDKTELKKFLKGKDIEECNKEYGCYLSENKNIGIR